MAPEVKLTDSELDEALAFIEAEGFAYYFPDPFEITAIRHSWNKVRPIISRANLLSYDPKPALELIAPKQKFAVRPIHLPDPVDVILFTGLGLRLAPFIEAARMGPHMIHSFRYEKSASGLPTFRSDWDSWVEAIGLGQALKPYAAKADIVDFFPRIYLHRLENALVAATGRELDVRALFRFLEAWSDGTSYGIPIGPKICNILAECLLSEVDEYLVSRNLEFIRYIDDFVFFGNSPTECLRALYLLAERLEQTQGLSLNMAKTKVFGTHEAAEQLADAGDINVTMRKNIIERVFGGDPYAEINFDDLNDEQKALLESINPKELLERALSADLVDLPMVGFVLNMLAGLRRPQHVDLVLDNLHRLLPVSHAVARFLAVFEGVDAANRVEIGARILNYIRESEFVPDYQVIWLLQPFASNSCWNGLADLRIIAREHKNRYVRRQAILALGLLGHRSALLDLKSSVNDAKDWEYRAIVLACKGLPKDEREAFWSKLRKSPDWEVESLTDRATTEFVKSLV